MQILGNSLDPWEAQIKSVVFNDGRQSLEVTSLKAMVVLAGVTRQR